MISVTKLAGDKSKPTGWRIMPCGARQNDLFLIRKKGGRFFPNESTATFLNHYLVGENRPTQQRENT